MRGRGSRLRRGRSRSRWWRGPGGCRRARAGPRTCENLTLATQQFRLGDTEMTATAVLEFLALLEASSIDVCLDGGWGVDALLGEQTREHGDLDVILNVEDLSRLAEATRSYPRKPGGTDTNFVLELGPGNEVDVHAI